MADIYGEGSNSKKQWDKLKGAPFKDKVKYIVQYYGIAIVAIIAGIVFVVSMVRTIIYNSIPVIISVDVCSSIVSETAEDYVMEKLSESLGVDPSKYHIEVSATVLDTSDYQQAYTMAQKIFARIAAADLDCIIAKETMLLSYQSAESADDRAFYDLRDLLPQDLYDRLLAENLIVFLDAADGQIPYGIDLTGTALSDNLGLVGEGNILVFIVSSPNTDAQKAFAGLVFG